MYGCCFLLLIISQNTVVFVLDRPVAVDMVLEPMPALILTLESVAHRATKVLAYTDIPANVSISRVAEEQNWQIALGEPQVQTHIVVAHVTLTETIHPNATEKWPQIGPFRIKGNLTNVKANGTSAAPLRVDVAARNDVTSITVLFEQPQTAKTQVTIDFDWPFRTDQIASPLTSEGNWLVFHWDALSVAQLQTDGMIICCDVSQNFTVVMQNLNITSLKHGASQIRYSQTRVGHKSIVRFSGLVPKGFLSVITGKPVPLVYDWIMTLFRVEEQSSLSSSSHSSSPSSPASSFPFAYLAVGILVSLGVIALPSLMHRGLRGSSFLSYFKTHTRHRIRLRYCSKCGTKMRQQVRFCTKCGAPQS